MRKPLAAAALAGVLVAAWADNSVDALVRGKWVRHFDTGVGDQTATVCLPAYESSELGPQIEGIPERIAGVQRAGATVVMLDMSPELLQPLANEGHLQRLADSGPIVVPTGLTGIAGSKLHVGDRAQAAEGLAHMTMGFPTGTKDAPLALVGLALHLGVAPPARTGEVWSIADHHSTPADDHHLFMPYLIPFVHWTDTATWAQAKGRIVTFGACRVDRDLTLYGRQPTAVAPGEWMETLLAHQDPKRVPWWVDALFAVAVLGGSAVPGKRRIRGLGALGLAIALGMSLMGWWMALTPIVLAAGLGIAWRGVLGRNSPESVQQ